MRKTIALLCVSAALPPHPRCRGPRRGRSFSPRSITRASRKSHHLVLSPDRRYAFVQNSLLNLPGLSDGSVTISIFGQ